MSRGQQGQVFDTATSQNTTYNNNANTAFKNANSDIGNYADAVGAFKAANPYVQGGSVETANNQQSADTAAGQAQQAGQALQGAAVRTGQNAGGAIAATEQMQDQNERNLIGQQAQNTKDTAAANTGYQSAVLGDTGNVENMQDQLATQQAQAAQGTLGTAESAANTPSFMDELGQGLISGGGQVGSAAVGKYCWIAAELYGGWDDWRTIRVRTWLAEDFGRSWYGALTLKAYERWGERISVAIRTRQRLRRGFQQLFDAALRRAVSHGR